MRTAGWFGGLCLALFFAAAALHTPFAPSATAAKSTTDFIVVTGEQGAPRDLKQAAIDRLSALLPTLDLDVNHSIAEAIQDIQASLDPKCWADDSHLTPKEGARTFNEECEAVADLQRILNNPSADQAARDAAQASISSLLSADDTLATGAIADAVALGSANPKVAQGIARANALCGQANTLVVAGQLYDAVKTFRKAWEAAQKALALGTK